MDSDISQFTRVLNYTGESSYGASFATALPGTPEANSLGPADFQGNGTPEIYFMQSGQDGEGDENSPGLDAPMNEANVRNVLARLVGHDDPLVLAWLFEANKAPIKFKNGWLWNSDAWYDPESNTVYINTDDYDTNAEAAMAVYKVLKDNVRHFQNLPIPDSANFQIRRQNAFEAGARNAQALEELVLTYASVIDVTDFGLALNSLMDKDIPVKTKLLIAVLAALPIVQGQMAKPASKIANTLFDKTRKLIDGKLDDLIELARAPSRGLSRLFGHNEYKVVDEVLAGKVKKGLLDFYNRNGGPGNRYVDDALLNGRNGALNTKIGEILIARSFGINFPT